MYFYPATCRNKYWCIYTSTRWDK